MLGYLLNKYNSTSNLLYLWLIDPQKSSTKMYRLWVWKSVTTFNNITNRSRTNSNIMISIWKLLAEVQESTEWNEDSVCLNQSFSKP